MSRLLSRSGLVGFLAVSSLSVFAGGGFHYPRGIMPETYWLAWSDEEQGRIEEDIERYRKADARIGHLGIPGNTVVEVEQLTHAFYFGAHAFNLGQLATPELNRQFRTFWGTFFNSATVAFYWDTLEPVRGRPRYRPGPEDSEAFWSRCQDPAGQPHWRRPPPDPIVDFCNSRGIRVHGHPIVWASSASYPRWLEAAATNEFGFIARGFCKTDPKTKRCVPDLPRGICELTPEELTNALPRFLSLVEEVHTNRIAELASRYGTRVQSWDVVNESCTDFFRWKLRPDLPVCRSCHERAMPADYVYKAFRMAGERFPKEVKLNINDYITDRRYAAQIDGLLARGARIDTIGVQRHIMTRGIWRDVISGADPFSPEYERRQILQLGTRAPIHISEITVPAWCEEEAVHPGLDNLQTAEMRQAIVARNLYRLWFSLKPVEGVTWWNSIDGCAYKGESATSGFFRQDLTPKPVYYAIADLINNEWKTRLKARTDAAGTLQFRGFKGRYRLTWNQDGTQKSAEIELR